MTDDPQPVPPLEYDLNVDDTDVAKSPDRNARPATPRSLTPPVPPLSPSSSLPIVRPTPKRKVYKKMDLKAAQSIDRTHQNLMRARSDLSRLTPGDPQKKEVRISEAKVRHFTESLESLQQIYPPKYNIPKLPDT